MSDKDEKLLISEEINEIAHEFVRLTLEEEMPHLDAISQASSKARARLETLLPLSDIYCSEGVNWVALNIKAALEAIERLRLRLSNEDEFLDVMGIVENVLFFSQGMMLHTLHLETEKAKGLAVSKAARKAAEARHQKNKEQKSKVLSRYYELIKFAHFKNGSRADLARKIAQEPGVTAKEITISRWIKEELEG